MSIDLMKMDFIIPLMIGFGFASLLSPVWHWLFAPKRYQIEFDSRSDSFRTKR